MINKVTPLHEAIKKLAGSKPALVFSNEAFRGFVLNGFTTAVERLQGASFPVDGYPSVEVRFTGISVNLSNFQVTLREEDNLIYADVSPGFIATFTVHVAKDINSEFSKIHLRVTNVNVKLSVNAPRLIFSNADYDVKGSIEVDEAGRDAALQKKVISKEDLLRVEGAMAYVIPRRLADAALSTIGSIDVIQIFTALEIGGDWRLRLIHDDEGVMGVAIIPLAGLSIRQNTGCPRKDTVPDLVVNPGNRKDVSADEYTWPLETGGWQGRMIAPPNTSANGVAAIYAPKPVWESRFSTVMPAIPFKATHDAFIGWEIDFTTYLTYVGLKIDPARFGIVVDLTLVGRGSAVLNIAVPCRGRLDLARVDLNGQSDLSILLRLALPTEGSTAGKLLLESSIDHLDVTNVDAKINLFAQWLLTLAGGGDVVRGIILTEILERAIQHNLPIRIREIVRNQVNSKNIQLLDLESLLPYAKYGFGGPTFSGDSDSVLVGLLGDRG